MKKKKHILYKIYPKKTIERIDAKMNQLGPSSKYSTAKFLNQRIFLTFLIFIFVLFFFKFGSFLAPIVSLFFYLFSEKVLELQGKRRAKKLEGEAVFFFEVLSLTLDSGRNIKAALEITSANISCELSEEFKKTLSEIKLGKSFTESLKAMKERIPSDTINNILLSLIQANVYGSSLTDSLSNQLDYLREKRILEIKAEITKLPTKISIVSVLFFIPIMLLVVLSPVIVEFFS